MNAVVQFPLDPAMARRLAKRAGQLSANPPTPTPREMGRLAAQEGKQPMDCPFPLGSIASRAWGEGWAEGFGIPKDWQGRAEMLLDRLCEVLGALADIRAEATPAIQAKVDQVMEAARRPRSLAAPLSVTP
jgi:hypothetical protein